MTTTTFELPSDCKGDGYDIACALHADDKPLQEQGVIREKIYVNGCFVGYTKHEVGGKVKSEAEAKKLPVGTVVHFNRWAAQCYTTVYYRVATYEVTAKKRGEGNYLKLVSSGYGSYPHIGGKYQPQWEGRISL